MTSQSKQDNFFLVIEGLDGSGKSTVARRLTHVLELNMGRDSDKIKLTFEPHDPSCGGLFIRQILSKKIRDFSPYILPLAFATNRLDHCAREINPFLDSGKNRLLICDRYFLSSLVYQSIEGLSIEDVMNINKYARIPDLIIFLDASNKICFERMKRRDESKELFEKNLTQTRNKYYQSIEYLSDKGIPIKIISAEGSVTEVLNEILNLLRKFGPKWLNLQPILNVDLLPNVFSMDNERSLSIKNIANRIVKSYIEVGKPNKVSLNKDLEEIRTGVRNYLQQLKYQDINILGSLFLDFVELSGYEIVDKLRWSDLDAFELKYMMPLEFEQQGIALMLSQTHRVDLILKKAEKLETKLSDFIIAFIPESSISTIGYYEREIIHNFRSRETISPKVKFITNEDLEAVILDKSLNLIYQEFYNTLHSDLELLTKFNTFKTSVGNNNNLINNE